jgi:hypothetical protein
MLSRSALGKLSSQSLVLLKEKVTNASFVNIVALGLWRTQNEIIDSIAVQVAQTLFIAFHKLLKVAMKDQLPDIKFFFSFLSLQYELKSLKQPLFSSTPHAKLLHRTLIRLILGHQEDEGRKKSC